MVRTVALIACSNGLGHIRRLIILSQALMRYGVEPTLFAPKKSVKKLSKTIPGKFPDIFEFDSKTTSSEWLDESGFSWYKGLPDLSSYERVVSDNLIEILLVRPDAWLMGGFFWHESLSNFSVNRRLECIKILSDNRPNMISSELFAAEYFSEYTNLYKVGLFCAEFSVDFNEKENKNLLISCGKGGKVVEVAKKFVKKLSFKCSTPFDKIFVEPDIFPATAPTWMVPATFTPEMYSNVEAAITRPGVGTVTDVLSSGGRIFSYYEDENIEMQMNSKKIALAGVGWGSSDIKNAWDRAVEYCENSNQKKEHKININKIDMNGAKEAARFVMMSLPS